MKTLAIEKSVPVKTGPNFWQKVVKDFGRNKSLYFMVLPVIAYYLIFHYLPMYGAVIAFKNFNPMKGIWNSDWVGFKYFYEFFSSFYFVRIIKNTLVISINTLIFSFPAPIILALLINELRSRHFSRSVQTITYLPHFISMVVFCGLIREFTLDSGIINYALSFIGWKPVTMLNQPELFVPIYVISDIFKEVGWGSIIYLAALAGIDPQLYEAAKIDGAGRFKQICYITLPSITPTIIILLILRLGNMLNVGFEKIILLYNPIIFETADVISTFVYRKGLLEFNWGFSAAVGLFNSVINFTLLIVANKVVKKLKGTALW